MQPTILLKEIGLEQYCENFSSNDIDDETLLGLTDEDLVAIGIASLGHRKTILSAIRSVQEVRGSVSNAQKPKDDDLGSHGSSAQEKNVPLAWGRTFSGLVLG